MQHFCQRYYDSQIGRFMTLDPVDDKSGGSPYAYCANNPLKFTDPTGEVSMAAEWVRWQMEDDAIFFGTMGENGIKSYTGWVPKNWFLGSSAELDPDFWAKGWEKSYMDKIREAINFISQSEWGKGIGVEIVKELYWLLLTGQISVMPGLNSKFNILSGISVGTFTTSYGREFLAITLVHEATHSRSFDRYAEISSNEWRKPLMEGLALLTTASFYLSEKALRNNYAYLESHPLGWAYRDQIVSYGWPSINAMDIPFFHKLFIVWYRYY